MDYIEVSGKNVDEALTNALIKLETTSDNVEYEVVEKGNSGFLGLFNKPAVIRVKKKKETEEIDFKSVIEKTSKPVKKQEKREYKQDKKDFKQEKKDEKKAVKPVEKSVEKVVETPKKVQKSADETVVDKFEEKSNRYTTVMPKEEIEKRINTFLTDMFKAMDMKVEITINFDDPECVNVELLGDNMGALIGKRGQTLDSIQYLTSIVVNKGKDKYVRIKLDTEDYRNRRKETLESLARNIAYKVKRSRRPVSLEPMNPYERRIIHSALQNDKFVSTRSEGEEPFRHVVVYLDKDKNQR